MTDKDIVKYGQLVEDDDDSVTGSIAKTDEVCAWTQFHFQSRVKSPQQGRIIRFKTGCSGKSHNALPAFCPDCGRKPIKTIGIE